MSDGARKRTIINRTDSSRDHQVRFCVMSKDGRPGEFRRLRAGEQAGFQEEDLLVVLTDRETNFQIRSGRGTVVRPFQYLNNHPDYPGQSVSVFNLEYPGGGPGRVPAGDEAMTGDETETGDEAAGASTEDEIKSGADAAIEDGTSGDDNSDSLDETGDETMLSSMGSGSGGGDVIIEEPPKTYP